MFGQTDGFCCHILKWKFQGKDQIWGKGKRRILFTNCEFEGLMKQLGDLWVYEYKAQMRDLDLFNGYEEVITIQDRYDDFKLSSITLFHF